MAQSYGVRIEVFWLQTYCPTLNMSERLWDHLKRTVLANMLFASIKDLAAALRRGVALINSHRNKMDFIFNHHDVNQEAV